MNLAWRISLYVLLSACAIFCTQRFFAAWNSETQRAEMRFEAVDPTPAESTEVPPADSVATTNEAAGATALTNPPASASGIAAAPAKALPAKPAKAKSHKGLFAALALFSLLALGLLVGHDVAEYFGHRVQREIYGEASEPVGDPEYDAAEQVWADGDHLEAIRLLRDFLTQKPEKLHAAFRIAEIYEKDLKNPLAAALEYEEILKHKFEPERWSWAAIHLVNLYNRINQTAKADALLQRIVNEFGDTPAAAKARERLNLPDDEQAAVEPDAAAQAAPEEGGFKLPPGFKPKKG
jgi:TolA-binding protein